MKKAQMEIMGLLIIVVLIVLVIMFSFTFSGTSSNNPDPIIDFTEAQLREGFVTALLATTTDCVLAQNKEPVRELLRVCVSGSDRTCPGGNDDQVPVCEYMNQTIENIVAGTFQTWETSFQLNISMRETTYTFIDNCSVQNRRRTASTDIFPTSSGNVFISLRFC